MSAAAWIAIAAIIMASINSWGQFWLKERSEKRKALADAKPATNQPKAVNAADSGLAESFAAFFRRRWRFVAIQFIINFICATYVLNFVTSTAPVSGRSAVLIALAVSVLVALSILPFVLRWV